MLIVLCKMSSLSAFIALRMPEAFEPEVCMPNRPLPPPPELMFAIARRFGDIIYIVCDFAITKQLLRPLFQSRCKNMVSVSQAGAIKGCIGAPFSPLFPDILWVTKPKNN